MLKACKYCGRVHDSRYDCGKKPVYRKRDTEVTGFHKSYKWTELSKSIRKRDSYVCQACLHDLDGLGMRITREDLEVHHIESIASNYDRRFDRDNLITLCRSHHELAEKNALSSSKLEAIAVQNDN